MPDICGLFLFGFEIDVQLVEKLSHLKQKSSISVCLNKTASLLGLCGLFLFTVQIDVQYGWKNVASETKAHVFSFLHSVNEEKCRGVSNYQKFYSN